MKLSKIGSVASEEKLFENVNGWPDARTHRQTTDKK